MSRREIRRDSIRRSAPSRKIGGAGPQTRLGKEQVAEEIAE